MDLLSPEIVADLCTVSPGLVGIGMFAGLVLWLFGWRSHRFWVVFTCTVVAGVWGMTHAAALKSQPLLTALLLALAAGMVALSLARVLAYFIGGTLGMILIQGAYPHLHHPILLFLISGLLCVCLYRFAMMVLTSFVGALICSYCLLALLNRYAGLDTPAWSHQGSALFAWAAGGMSVLGLAVQIVQERKPRKKSEEKKKDKDRDRKDSKKKDDSKDSGFFQKVMRIAG